MKSFPSAAATADGCGRAPRGRRATAPTRRLRDHAFDDSLDDLLAVRRAHQGDHAAEARGPPRRRHVTKPLEQEPPARPVVEPRAAEPRRVEPRRARERVDFEP